jgi:hypothetical protein
MLTEPITVNTWYSIDDPIRPPLLPFCSAASVHCFLMVASGDTEEFQYMVGWYNYGTDKFIVMQNGIDILELYGLRVTHWRVDPTPSNKII